MKYLVYKTTNKINGKIYIGAHKTKDLDDGYMGSGTYIRSAFAKYGRDNFSIEILFRCESEKEMFEKEAEIVNEEFIKLKSNYNLMPGGKGGWTAVNKSGNGLKGASMGGKIGGLSCTPHKPHKKHDYPTELNSFNCSFCNIVIKREGNLLQHERSCSLNPNKSKVPRKSRKVEETFTCDCGKQIIGKASFTRHNNSCDSKVL